MPAMLHRLLALSTLTVAVISLPTPYSKPPVLDSAYQRCKPISDDEWPSRRSCARHFSMGAENTWHATFPNARGFNVNDSMREFSDFSSLLEMDNYCSRMLYTLLCFYYFPPCSLHTHPGMVVQPCQEVCREATEACLPAVRALSGGSVGLIPPHLNCSNFEEYRLRQLRYFNPERREDRTRQPNTVLACPNSSIHVDFSLSPGKLVYEVSEGAGSLQVCLTLANTGSYDVNHTLSTPVTVQISTIQRNSTTHATAKPGVDYTPLNTTIVFPEGSGKRNRLCTTVSIIGNSGINTDKIFGLEASILSPSSADIGGSHHSSTGIIDAIILDDDGIHVIFELPSGRTSYMMNEDEGWVEVCLALQSDFQAVLNRPASVTLTPIQTTSTIFVRAEEELDYSRDQVVVVFPTGSGVGHRECANLSITIDGLIEPDESFRIRGSVDSQSLVRFTSSFANNATVDVIIRDDDECTIPADQCRRNCDMRDNANRGLFRHNCFDYAARVHVMGERHLQGCSTLDVTVRKCWELKPGVCVANGTRLSVPFCNNCQTNVTSDNGDYLIAGLHDLSAGLILPNYKKAGLISEWNDRKYSSMEEWVQIGIQNRSAYCDA